MKPDSGRFFKKRTLVLPTWRLLLVVVAALLVGIVLPYRIWLSTLGGVLVERQSPKRADVILVEVWERPSLSTFTTAAKLKQDGYADRTILLSFRQTPRLDRAGIVIPRTFDRVLDLYCEEVCLDPAKVEKLCLTPTDPITLNMAIESSQILGERGIRSVILVTGPFHSARSARTYRKFFEPLGIQVISYPTEGHFGVDNWWQTKDGRLNVGYELVKYVYYRLFVL